MTQLERLSKLNRYLLSENPEHSGLALEFGADEDSQFNLFRTLVNIRPPYKAQADFLSLQNEYLSTEIRKKGIADFTSAEALTDEVFIWKGDITTLQCDAVVNAANSRMLGCFCPCHKCIDNAIHTFSGVQLRLACHEIMKEQGYDEPVGHAKITPAFNLPCRFVIHTVGPMINDRVIDNDCSKLASCYRASLELACKNGLDSIAFCCISTGEFHFPNEIAARVAIKTVMDYKKNTESKIKVIFNVFKQTDYDIYRSLFTGN